MTGCRYSAVDGRPAALGSILISPVGAASAITGTSRHDVPAGGYARGAPPRGRAARLVQYQALQPVCMDMLRCFAEERAVMLAMRVIVRLQDRGAQRLDPLHDQALCRPEG